MSGRNYFDPNFPPMRRGKTKRDHKSGAWARTIKNKKTRAQDNHDRSK